MDIGMWYTSKCEWTVALFKEHLANSFDVIQTSTCDCGLSVENNTHSLLESRLFTQHRQSVLNKLQDLPTIIIIIIIIMYLYSAQYLHILQDSKRYLTNRTVQVQPQLTSNWHSPNWKMEAQGWPFINVLEVL